MGTGKTLTAIGITGAARQLGKVNRVLIVAPKTILGVWRDEFQKYAAFDYDLAILTKSTDCKAAKLASMKGKRLQIAAVNYESVWRIEPAIQAWSPDLVIADEGHRIKTHNTSASKAMHRIGERARFKLLLTGTIIANRALDVFSQYKYLNHAVFGTSFYRFRNRYFDMMGYMMHMPVLKRSMEDELMERIHSIAYRATKADCLDLPETTDVVRQVTLEPAARLIYDDIVKHSIATLSEGEVSATNILTRLLRLSQLTGGFLTTDDDAKAQCVSTAKIDALAEILEAAEEESQKVVIMARFLPELKAIKDMLTRCGISYAGIQGDTTDRDTQVATFQNDPECMVFVGQVATAGQGLTLTAASTMIFFSLDFSMSNYEQAKARIHRVGQHNPCTYIHLTAVNTVDEKILAALRSKADLARTLIDDYRRGRNPFTSDGYEN